MHYAPSKVTLNHSLSSASPVAYLSIPGELSPSFPIVAGMSSLRYHTLLLNLESNLRLRISIPPHRKEKGSFTRKRHKRRGAEPRIGQ